MGWSLTELIQRHNVPGAQVAVLVNGEIADEAAGMLNVRTGVGTTTDSLFQIGSITKIWTATLCCRLVNSGVLDLDRPVRSYLPDFELSTSADTMITARHLLAHTSGIDGNLFTDTGRNDDAIARFVAGLATADQLFPPGSMFSYSNSGYAVLGRLVEVLHDRPFHEVLRSELAAPLGLRTALTADEAILHRAAVGHHLADGTLAPVPTWALPYSNAPGSALTTSARDLLEFARGHLTDAGDYAALREPQVTDIPNFGAGVEAWGLGWMLYGDGVIGHTGTTYGQKAFLRLVPSAGVAVAVLTNSPGGAALAHEIFTHTLREHAGVETPPLTVPPTNPAPVDDWMCGTYRGTKVDYTVSVEDDRAFVSYTARDEFGQNLVARPRDEVVRLDDTSFITAQPEFGVHAVYSFVGRTEDDRARFLHNSNAHYRIA